MLDYHDVVGDLIEPVIRKHAEKSMKSVEKVYKEAHEFGYENTQWFLDWLDKLNAISVDNIKEE